MNAIFMFAYSIHFCKWDIYNESSNVYLYANMICTCRYNLWFFISFVIQLCIKRSEETKCDKGWRFDNKKYKLTLLTDYDAIIFNSNIKE